MVKEDLKVNLVGSDVVAIHCIPGKPGQVQPKIAKVRDTELKISIMRKKKNLKMISLKRT